MTDSEKLDIILQMLSGQKKEIIEIRKRLATVEDTTKSTKKQLLKTTAELKTMDEMIFDELERVHTILNRHIEDRDVHKTA